MLDGEDVRCERLLLAVIERAALDLSGVTEGANGYDQTPAGKLKLASMAREWFDADLINEPFSFAWCCRALDLDAGDVRARVFKLERLGPIRGFRSSRMIGDALNRSEDYNANISVLTWGSGRLRKYG